MVTGLSARVWHQAALQALGPQHPALKGLSPGIASIREALVHHSSAHAALMNHQFTVGELERIAVPLA